MTQIPARFMALLVVFAIAFAALGARSALAEEGGLRGLLGDLVGSDDNAQPAPAQGAKRVPLGREEMQLSFSPLVKDTAPAVVNVYAKQLVRARSPFAGDPFFEQFFGRQMPPRVQSSLGSGVIVDPSGIVVTNYHVIRNAEEVKVATSDGLEFESEVLLKDESLDLAVLKIDGEKDFPALAFGNSDALEVGDLVLAIGNPFGVGQTTTSGIISALARNHVGVSDFGFFIQTDAAINPGNSGGALIDMNGRLVGINTAIYSRSGGSNGIGFAIPANMVRTVVASAQRGEDNFERPYIGAAFEPVSAQIAEALGMDRAVGALVSSVDDRGPAANAGLKPGDVVVRLNDVAIEHVDALGYRLATQSVGSTARLVVERGGEKRELDIELARAPDNAGSNPVSIDGRSPFAGVRVADLSPRLAQRLRLPTRLRGVAVVEVARNSPAENIGLRPRDIVRQVNGQEISTAASLSTASAEETRWWRFTIERDGRLIRQMIRF